MKGTIRIWFSPICELHHFTCEIKLCLEAFETVEKGQLFWERTLISSPFLSLWLLGALTAERMLCAKRLPAVRVFLYKQLAHLSENIFLYSISRQFPNAQPVPCRWSRPINIQCFQNPPSPHLMTQIRYTEKQKPDPGLVEQARTWTLLRVDAFCLPFLTCVLPNVGLLSFWCGGIIWGISRCCETWFPQRK